MALRSDHANGSRRQNGPRQAISGRQSAFVTSLHGNIAGRAAFEIEADLRRNGALQLDAQRQVGLATRDVEGAFTRPVDVREIEENRDRRENSWFQGS